jgi:hypothetical protein
MIEMLNESAAAVRDAVRGRLSAGQPMDRHYDHQILMLQHLIWHEGYHHGQIKLTLKLHGHPISDAEPARRRVRDRCRMRRRQRTDRPDPQDPSHLENEVSGLRRQLYRR